ncbi:uncharacterized protein LOC100572062 [Acyrthosiphon pisum]|uniref:Uncharacterized protein n=1 Tax=Acyrthosiphon pisum TaxID=7029 RepID=A0A8R2AZ30_ACYPI|nr:uncharacterized protein LOC100572062 [Acyrthosiphon pisum]|eukprot:XP_008178894.2 PREDICTED: uncharacterized protein LOC100572062 [Acyrthosiphon pisum]
MSSLIIKYGFQSIKPHFLYTNDKGKMLYESNHVLGVQELKLIDGLSVITGSVVRQTSVTLEPYKVKLEKHSIIVEIIGKMSIKTFGLILFFSSTQSENIFRPNLPLGEYRIVIDKVYPCETTKNHPIQYNWYFSKKTSKITELKGNTTFLIPFDDTLTLDYNFASWGSTGGWVPNAYILNTKKACSTIKNLGGNAWYNYTKGFNMPTDKCPLPVGTYITPGIDKKNLEDMNFPKVYFYGKYKLVCRYKNLKNEVVSCIVVELNLMRPWETPI